MRLLIITLSILLMAFDKDISIIGAIHSTIPSRNIIIARVATKKYGVRLNQWFASRYRVVAITSRHVTLEDLNGAHKVFMIGGGRLKAKSINGNQENQLDSEYHYHYNFPCSIYNLNGPVHCNYQER